MSLSTVREAHALTQNTFKDFIEQHDMVLVGFVLPFLSVFQRFVKECQEASQQLLESGVQFAIVDCTKETEVSDKFKFRRWPTVKLFRGFDSITDYEGAWQTSNIVSWITRQLLPTVSMFTPSSFQEFRSKSDVVVVGFLASDDTSSRNIFKAVAEALHKEYVFGIANDDTLAESEDIKVPGIALYKTFDEKKNDAFGFSHDVQTLTALIRNAGTPLVPEFQPEIHNRYVDTGLPLGYIIGESADELAHLRKAIAPLAKRYQGKIIFGTVDVQTFDSIAEDMRLELDKWPAFAIKDIAPWQCFPLSQNQPLSEQVITSFVDEFFEGKLKPCIRSERAPETQEGPVTVIVGHTYNEIVLNNDKDVLVDYYTQWFGPCKAMAPIYERLASLYASNPIGSERFTVAKVDAEANDVPGDIRGFPTFKLFPAGSKESPV